MIISFSLRRPGPPAIAGTHCAGAASRVPGSGFDSRGGRIYARGAADARPVSSTARPSRGGGGGRRPATVTPVLDLPLGGWGEPGFNWRLFWGAPDAMLWKITDNVKYEEDCEVSRVQGRSPAPPQPSPGGGGPGAERAARARERRAGSSLCPAMGRGAPSPGPPSRLGPFPKPRSRAGPGKGRAGPPAELTGRVRAKPTSPSSSPFVGGASRLQPQTWLVRAASASGGSDEATCRRHLGGVPSAAGLSPAPLAPRGREKTTEVWLSREVGAGERRWGGPEAGRGRERSGVLQPVGQVELEFRGVGGRQAASGKRKTRAAGGVRRGAGGGEPALGATRAGGCAPAGPHGAGPAARPGTSARGRQCHVVSKFPATPVIPANPGKPALGELSRTALRRGTCARKVAQNSGSLSLPLCPNLCGYRLWPGEAASPGVPHSAGTQLAGAGRGGAGWGAFLRVLPGRRWVAGLPGSVACREVFVLRAWKGGPPGRGRCALPASCALSAFAASPRSFVWRRRHVRASERAQPARCLRHADFLPRPESRLLLAQGLGFGPGSARRLGRRSSQAFGAGL